MAVQKLSKKNIDVEIATIISLQEQIKKLKDELKVHKNAIETLYKKGPAVVEIIEGIDYEAEKIPVHNGAHDYDVDKVAKILLGITNKRVKAGVMVKVVDGKKFEALIEDGYVTEEMAAKCRLEKITCKTAYRQKVEKAAENVEEAKEKKAKA